jgi:hypothetical protein
VTGGDIVTAGRRVVSAVVAVVAAGRAISE